jgi:hypothetical protein
MKIITRKESRELLGQEEGSNAAVVLSGAMAVLFAPLSVSCISVCNLDIGRRKGPNAVIVTTGT